MSALMILPFGPVPETDARLRPWAAAKPWATGLAKTLSPLLAGATGAAATG